MARGFVVTVGTPATHAVGIERRVSAERVRLLPLTACGLDLTKRAFVPQAPLRVTGQVTCRNCRRAIWSALGLMGAAAAEAR